MPVLGQSDLKLVFFYYLKKGQVLSMCGDLDFKEVVLGEVNTMLGCLRMIICQLLRTRLIFLIKKRKHYLTVKYC